MYFRKKLASFSSQRYSLANKPAPSSNDVWQRRAPVRRPISFLRGKPNFVQSFNKASGTKQITIAWCWSSVFLEEIQRVSHSPLFKQPWKWVQFLSDAVINSENVKGKLIASKETMSSFFVHFSCLCFPGMEQMQQLHSRFLGENWDEWDLKTYYMNWCTLSCT